MQRRIFEKIANFLDKKSPQRLEEARKLYIELQDELLAQDGLTASNLNQENNELLKTFYACLSRLYSESLNAYYNDGYSFSLAPEQIIKPYLEPPEKPFRREWKGPIMKIRRFLKDERVRAILRFMPSVEDQIFIISVLEPFAFSWIRRGTKEMEAYVETFTSSSLDVAYKISKPGPKSIANECIILLVIHFRNVFKCFEKCNHKHLSIYRCIADLFNTCEIEGRKDWNLNQIKMRYDRLRRESSFIKGRWEEYYRNKFCLYSDIGKRVGLKGLIRRYLH